MRTFAVARSCALPLSVNRFLACFLAALLLLQTLGLSLLLANYELNKAQITARFCGKKACPALHFNGKSYFA